MQREGKRCLFSPAGSGQFLVYGSSDVRLYEWKPRAEPRRYSLQTLTTLGDLPPFRTVAWHPKAEQLVAIGLATGRTLLCRLTDPAANYSAASTAPFQSASLNVRQQRPINALAFSQAEPNLLAVGLEKARDHAVHIFDIERSVKLLDAKMASTSSDRVIETSQSPVRTRLTDATRTSVSPAPEVRPFTLLGSGEAANSVLFLNIGSNTSSQLVVGMGGKSIRVYDIRERPLSASQSLVGSQAASSQPERSTRAVYGLAGDPFDGHRFVSADDAGIIKLWDARYAADAVLTFSEGEQTTAGSLSDRSVLASTPRRGGGLLGIHFCPSRRGLLASMDANTSVVRFWDVWQGAERWTEPVANHEDSEAFVPLVLGQCRHSAPFSRPPSSFAFNTAQPREGSLSICSVSREGHIEFIQHPDPALTAWSSDGEFASLQGREIQIWSSNESVLGTTANRTRSIPNSMPQTVRPSYSRMSSAIGERTPRAPSSQRHMSLQDDDIKTVVDRLVQLRDAEEEDAPNVVASDVSTLMKGRVHLGYGAEAARNARLTTEGLSEFWTWISHADSMASKSRSIVNKYDFAFAGTLSILKGVHSISDRDKVGLEMPRSVTPVKFGIAKDVPNDPALAHEEVARALKRTGISVAANDASKSEQAYTAATQQLIEHNGINAHITTPSKKLQARRKLALAMCGPEFASDDKNAVAQYAEDSGQAERAAAWAVFSGNTEEAVHSLKSSKNERLKLLAPTLAAYATRSQVDPVFGELYSSLSTDLEDPFLRSVFAYLADKSWLDVLDEQALPLRDRLGIALRYLPDNELLRYLDLLAKSLTADGDLEGIALTGLTGHGFELLQNYIDRTGDIQTVALAVAYVHPGRIFDRRAEMWIATYRYLMDRWRLFVPRARFDVARGARMRKTQELLATAGAPMEAVDMAPTRLLIRCHYCNKTIAPARLSTSGAPDGSFANKLSSGGAKDSARQRPYEARLHRMKTTSCPWCHKSFPKCSICLVSLAVPDSAYDNEPPPAWCWCQRCRHGGHATHLSEWFRTHAKCSVADCACECAAR